MAEEAANLRPAPERDADSLYLRLQAAFSPDTPPEALRAIATAILSAVEAEDDD